MSDYFNIGADLKMFEDNELVEVRADVLRAAQAKLEAIKRELEICLRAKSNLYPPGARYLNNPDNMNDPRMVDERGEIVEP